MLSFFDTAVNTNGTITHRDLSLNPFTFAFGFFSDHIISGLVVTHPDAGDFLQASITAGTLQVGGQAYAFGAGTPSITANGAANPRIDLVCANVGFLTIQIVAGTASASPTPPALPVDCYVLGYLYHIAGSTSLGGVSFSIQTPLPAMPVGFVYSNGSYIESLNVTFNIPVPTGASNTVRSNGASQWVEATQHKVTNEGFEYFGFVGNAAQPLGAGTRLMYLSDLGSLAVGTVSGTAWNAPIGANSLSVGNNVRLDGDRTLSVGNLIFALIGTENSLLVGTNLNTGGAVTNSLISGSGHSISVGATLTDSLITGQTLNLNAGASISNSVVINSGIVNPLLSVSNSITALNNSSFDAIINSCIIGANVGGSGTIVNSVGFCESSNFQITYSLFNTQQTTINTGGSLLLSNGTTGTNPLAAYDRLFIAKNGAFNLEIGASQIGFIGTVNLGTAILASEKSFFIGDDIQATGGGTSKFLGAFNCSQINYNTVNSQYRNSIGLLGTDLPGGFLNTDFCTYVQRIKRNGFEIVKVSLNPASGTMVTPAITTTAIADEDHTVWTAGSNTRTLDANAPIGSKFVFFSTSGTNTVIAAGGQFINGAANIGFPGANTARTLLKIDATNYIAY